MMCVSVFLQALVFAYDFHAGGETMMSRHFNDPNADGYFTKRKWGKRDAADWALMHDFVLRNSSFVLKYI